MLITGMHLEETPDLGNQISLSFDGKVNLFIGPNASGKSTILRSIKSLLAEGQGNNSVRGQDGSFLSMGEIYTLVGRVPFIYIPSTRVNLHKAHLSKVFPDLPDSGVQGEVDHRGPISSASMSDVIRAQERFYNRMDQLSVNDFEVFIGESVEIEIDWFGRVYPDLNSFEQKQIAMALNMSYLCARAICPEILQGDTLSFISNSFTVKKYIQVDDDQDELDMRDEWEAYNMHGIDIEIDEYPHLYYLEKYTRRGIGAKIIGGSTDKSLYLGVLSSGTQGTFLWILSLALRMLRHNKFTENWQKKPAILFIDEIENHLHPTWQRRVIPALREHFPGLQIFATTHSPFVVAGLKAGQVHLLNRDENGRVTATTNTEDVIGWTSDEILRTMMGVDEPTDQLTVDRANRLRQLREKDALTAEEESELNALRRQVNESLLSKGGPLEAQRDRYADLMQRFLRSRQSELSQDGE